MLVANTVKSFEYKHNNEILITLCTLVGALEQMLLPITELV